jgi:O-antigen/teichoic acid export membrane protein
LSALSGDRLVAHNLIVVGGTLSAGVLGVAFQAAISHRLSPSDYGSVFAVITLLTLISLAASALSLVMARQTSRDRATGSGLSSAALLKGGNRALLLGGTAAALLLAVAAAWLKDYFDVSTQMILLAALAVPFSLALPLLFGELQGEQRFVALSSLMAGQAAIKLGASLVLGALLGPTGVILGISIGTALIYFIALWLVRTKLTATTTAAWFRPALGYLTLILPSTLAIGILFSADVLVVKHAFPVRTAGEYSAVAALGRAVFWGAVGVATVLFPKAAFRQAQGRSGAPLVAFSLLLVVLGGVGGSIVLGVISTVVLTTFAGASYAAGASYLPWYALGMTLFGAATVLITAQQSRGERRFLAVLIPMAIIEPLLLARFHQSLLEVVLVVDACIAVLLTGLAVPYLLGNPGKPVTSLSHPRKEDLLAPSNRPGHS